MKFYCDACNTKYAISDDKVRGKVLKVRCKNCGNIISVREARAPDGSKSQGSAPARVPGSRPGPTASPRVPVNDWYYALNGQTHGPFTLDGLRAKYRSAAIGDATYVWHDTLPEWLPVATVDAFKEALAAGQKIKPARKTLGFTGPLEAIKDVAPAQGAQKGVAPAATSAEGSAPRSKTKQQTPSPEASRPAGRSRAEASKPAPTPESRPLKDLRKDKLELLRARLGSSSGQSSAPAGPEPDTEKVVSGGQSAPRPRPSDSAGSSSPVQPAGLSAESSASATPPTDSQNVKSSSSPSPSRTPGRDAPANERADVMGPDRLPSPVGGEAVFTFADGVTPASSGSSQELPRSAEAADAMNFDLPPRARPTGKPSPSSTSDILDAVIGPVAEKEQNDSAVDSGVIPFLSGAPHLEGGSPDVAAQSSQVSGSLLIQLGQIQKEGRGKRWIVIGLVVVLIGGLAGAAGFVALQEPQTRSSPSSSATPALSEQKDDLVIPRYSKDEVDKLATLNLEEELLFDEDEVEEKKGAEEAPEQAPTKAEPAKVAVGKASDTTRKSPRPAKEPTKIAVKEEPKQETAPVEEEPEDIYKALLSKRAGKSHSIQAPADPVLDKQGNKTGLTKDEARRGFARVKMSVRDCRERHNRYSARLDAGKLKLSVTVEPSGRVSNVSMQPRSVRNTEFERCMQSHKGRWRFAQFNGKEVVINTSIVMQ